MNTKQALITISIVVVLAIGGLMLFLFLHSGSQSSGVPSTSGTPINIGGAQGPTTVTPSSGSGEQQGSQGGSTATTLSVATQNGGSVAVKDFKSDPSTATTSNIPGHYFISGGVEPSDTQAPYSILYVDSDQSFTISLWTEPLADVRHLAEQELLSRLGITQAQACSLRYSVLVPNDVNAVYSGKNLGFSFCPGATKL